MASRIYQQLGENTYLISEPDRTYSLNYSGNIDSTDSLEQAIYCILMTERYSNPIYNDDYGVELEQYIGKDIGYIKATIENTLRDALTYDDRINDVVVTSVTKSTKQESACLIEFTVITKDGDLDESMVLGERVYFPNPFARMRI